MSDTLILRLRSVKAKPRSTPPIAETRVLMTPSDLFPVKPASPADVESKTADTHQTRDDHSRGGRRRANREGISDEVDVACDEFEEQCVKETRPRIEDFLHRVPGDSRETLLIELVALELDYRRQRGESPLLSEYVARFPRYALDLRELEFGQAEKSQDLDFQIQDAEVSSDEALRDFQRATEKTLRFEPTPAEKIDKFLLVKKVGTGSYGSVWRAWDDELQRHVAIKLPRQGDLDAEELKKFVREAQAAAQLKHDHIVAVYQVCSDPLNPYIVSHFIDGVSLKDWLTGKEMTPREAAAFCVKLARALAHAHGRGVIHRDVKPGNIMVDDAGEPHLTDFGLAKRENAEATLNTEGAIMGTPAYMSPEQARGEGTRVTPVTDLYSLGVIFYELLAGKPPFRGKVTIVLKQVIHDEPPPPSKAKKGIPRDLETICLKAMSKEVGRRYASAEDFALDLERFLRGEPIQARRTSLAGRAMRWVRRNPHLAGASVLCGTLAFGLLLFALNPRPPIRQILPERVLVETNPAGAAVVIVPLDPVDGNPEPSHMISPKGKTPLEVELPAGDYLVVVTIQDQGFHEVYRTVPLADQPQRECLWGHKYFERGEDGLLHWKPIRIRREPVGEKMALIPKCDDFGTVTSKLGEHFRIPEFYLDVTELTYGTCRKLLRNPPNSYRADLLKVPPKDDQPYNYVSYDEAMMIAESCGKRLPEELEYKCAATNGGRQRYPWGNQFPPEWEKLTTFGAVQTTAIDHIDVLDPATGATTTVFGLCSNVAEWSRSWTPYSLFRPPGVDAVTPPGIDAETILRSQRLMPVKLSRIVNGGSGAVCTKELDFVSTQRNPDNRVFMAHHSWLPGLGLRCAKSSKPRLKPEDFITRLPSLKPNTGRAGHVGKSVEVHGKNDPSPK